MSYHTAATRHLAWAAVLLLAPAAFAGPHDGVIYLKDGRVLKGVVIQSTETIIDPVNKDLITLHKGIFVLDDYCRRYFFSHAFVDHADSREFDLGTRVVWDFPRSFPDGLTLPPVREVLDVGKWDDKWNRNYHFRYAPDREIKLSQHLSFLSPHYARVDANCIDPANPKKTYRYPWTSYYPTRELGPQTVLALLSTHDKYKDKPELKEDQRADRRFQVFNFLVQAGWMAEAEKELARIKSDFPKEKEKVETAAEGIKKLVAFDRWDEIKLAHAAGRHEAAQKLLADFPAENADDQTQAEARALKAKYELAGAALKRAKELLTNLAKEVEKPADKDLFAEAAPAVAAELNLDHFLKKGDNGEGRLDRFVSQAEQAERLAKQQMSHLAPEELLSLAVTGWMMGSAAAEAKPEAAARVWRARKFLMEYRKTADPAARAKLLSDYGERSGLTVAEMAQLIPALPPPDPPPAFPPGPVVGAAHLLGQAFGAQALAPAGAPLGSLAQALAAPEVATLRASAPETLELKAPPAFGTKGVTYTVQLPPEYHPGRAYPVLVALHHGKETAKDTIERWGAQAARHGYVLAAPNWDPGQVGTYLYTAEEHAAVLDTLRDLGRHFNVDEDRVFLTGHGEGGNMAWDVGLSHPDLFAGVVPMNGQPRYHARAYWTNALALPFYVVWGERMGGPVPVPDKHTNGNLVNFEVFKDHWITGGFPALGVQYKGRGLEWFPAEVPAIFEWMAQKRRQNPPKVGFKDRVSSDPDPGEYAAAQRTMRPGDNHFYWLSVDGNTRLNEALAWNPNGKFATVSGKIANDNKIGVFADGVKQVTVWLGRGTIDFEKPVALSVNYSPWGNPQKVKPSMAVLLEDFYQRGDRQRLYVAQIRIELKKK
jgi:pimeloyl-ACP methyl ester carboxylesterase